MNFYVLRKIKSLTYLMLQVYIEFEDIFLP